jgi:hypothetical protein
LTRLTRWLRAHGVDDAIDRYEFVNRRIKCAWYALKGWTVFQGEINIPGAMTIKARGGGIGGVYFGDCLVTLGELNIQGNSPDDPLVVKS